ncbi:hypothetical protein Q1695_002140 [Nippostrongylus brasiliensis]|nr:hypothetical protein Q1695_002140 [Nippostrongylus brasiliensis]
MQSDSTASQPKRIRTESKSSAECLPTEYDEATTSKRETINNLITTLQRLRDGDDCTISPATIEALNSMARAHSTPTTAAPTSKCSQSEELMPALQAVPYIIPQQKLGLPTWNNDSLSTFQLIQEQQLRSTAGQSQIGFVTSTAPFSNMATFNIFSAMEGPCLPVSKRSQEAYARSNESGSRIEFAQRQKTKMLTPKLRCTTYATQHASAAQTTVIQDASLPSASKFSSGKMFTPPGAMRTRKADYSAPAETGAIRKAPPRGSNHSKGMLPMYNTPMMISKAQLLSNQPLDPFSVEHLSCPATSIGMAHTNVTFQNNYLNANDALLFDLQQELELKRRKQREQILVDTSVRECNEWSIYSVSLPTQLHVKCQCFAENT